MTKSYQEGDTTPTHEILAKGLMVAHYRIVKLIGEGGMGEVYLAEDIKLKRQVALKFLLQKYSNDDKARARFRREAETAAKLDHPNIVTVFEVGDYNSRPFFAMQFIDGQTLSDFIKIHPLTINQVIDLASQICEGLIEAHSRGVIHKDLKPLNVLIDSRGRPKVVDFGIAVIQGDDSVTQTGSIQGTPGYMSPEQIAGQDIDHRTDIFSFGVLLFEMLTGEKPFSGAKSATTMYSILYEEPKNPCELNDDIPLWLGELNLRLLEKNPADRIANANEVLVHLKQSVKGVATGTTTLDMKKRRMTVTVLDLKNLSEDISWEYYCEGFTEDIINDLKERTKLIISAQPESKMPKDIKAIFSRCRTDFIISGTLLRWKNRIRLSLSIHGEYGNKLISHKKYEGPSDDLFKIVTKAGQIVAEALSDITGSSTKEILEKHTPDLSAYDFYKKGRKYSQTLKPEYLDLAENMFKHAITIDPKMALAHTGLADVYVSRYMAFHDRSPKIIASAKQEAQIALEIDPVLPEAHRALGRYFMEVKQPDEAEMVLLKAVSDDPDYALGYRSLAWLKLSTSKFEEALRYAKKALELAPTDLETLLLLSFIHIDTRKYTMAMATLQRTVELGPDYGRAYYSLGDVYMKLGNPELALENFLMAIKYQGDPNCYIDAGYVYLLRNEYQNAREMFMKSIEQKQLTFVAHYYLGLTEQSAGNEKEAQRQFDLTIKSIDAMDHTDGYNDHVFAFKAMAYASNGEKEAALKVLDRHSPDKIASGEVLFFFARAVAILGDMEKSKTFLYQSFQRHNGPTEQEAKLDPHFKSILD